MHQNIKLDYEIGDVCWVNIGDLGEDGSPIKTKGHVVYTFSLPHHSNSYYVIELAQPYWMTLEIRDALLMADTEEGVLPVWHKEPKVGSDD